jgi:protein-S-isoprenylcysteine O-methyltransferase Ste14
VRTAEPRLLRDVVWSAIGVCGAFGAVRVMEAFRPEVISDDFSAPESDNSIRELGRAYALSACSMAAGPFARSARLPSVCGALGLSVQIAAVVLRVWSMRTLRGHYARGLRVVEGQPVIQAGPYRYVRHPGYLSAVLAWLGAAVSTRNAVPVALTLVAVGTAYRHRMDAEDALLIRDLPGYAEYAATTSRMVPSLNKINTACRCGGISSLDSSGVAS